MWNIKFKKLVIFAGVLLLQPMVSPGSFALAKRRPPKAFSFWAEGGKASQEECDGERKIPRKLKHLKEYAKSGSYMGSEVQTFEIKGKDDKEMWKHFFGSKSSCNAVLAKTPSYANKSIKSVKQELPPEEAVETVDEEQQTPKQTTEDGPDAPKDGPQEGPQDGPEAPASPETAAKSTPSP
ncbi:hypothetical protein [Bdellovibrio sp. HCB337]|uniref:hypothetical protein n=1 Tax=Bdellovibrio sp. HCB337 TaxID=3394358 RepID=UPI0039A5749A